MRNSTTKQLFFNSRSSVDVNKLIALDGWQCAYCGKFLTTDLMTVDHVLPTSRGGPDILANTVISCLPCNAQKGDMNLEEYTHYMNVRRLAESFDGDKPTNAIYELSVPGFTSMTVCFFPALALGRYQLRTDELEMWRDQGAVIATITNDVKQDTVVFISGPLRKYYQWKQS